MQTNEFTMDCGGVRITISGPDAGRFLKSFLATALPDASCPPVAAPLLPEGEWLTAAMVGRALGLSRQLVGYWVRKGWLPAPTLSPSGYRLWNADELRAFLASPALPRVVWRRLHARTANTVGVAP